MNSEGLHKLTKEELIHKVSAQQKTIEVLMDTVEGHAADGISSLALLSENINLEGIVKRKTERIQRQGEELQQALHELQLTQSQLLQAKKLESVGQLAAGIAHEINTPTQFITSNIDFLKDALMDVTELVNEVQSQIATLSDRGAAAGVVQRLNEAMVEADWDYLQEEIPSAMKQTQEGLKHITTIVQAMKTFSHPSGKEKVLVDINKLLENTIIVARNEWKYVADFQTEFDQQLPKVSCFPDELGQVFLNMIVNSAHALEEEIKKENRKEKGVIRISTCLSGNCIDIRISDDGCGIEEKFQENVFDLFFTTKDVGKGTGQGLSIAHDIITRKHDGTITFESTLGEGTEFLVRLPL